MGKFFSKVASAVAIAGLAISGLSFSAPSAEAMGCGYQVFGNDYWYNHCGSGNVKIKIDRVIGSEYKCVGPGATPIDRGFWRPTNAFYIDNC